MAFRQKLGLSKSKDNRSKHPLYRKWKQMMEIAYDREDGAQPVHEPWWEFWNFQAYVQPLLDKRKIKEGLIFCRYDCTKPWAPGNVRFVRSMKSAVWGKKSTHKIEFNGKKVGTRFVHRLLKKQGIDLNLQTIRNRAHDKQDPFAENRQFTAPKDSKTGRFLPRT